MGCRFVGGVCRDRRYTTGLQRLISCQGTRGRSGRRAGRQGDIGHGGNGQFGPSAGRIETDENEVILLASSEDVTGFGRGRTGQVAERDIAAHGVHQHHGAMGNKGVDDTGKSGSQRVLCHERQEGHRFVDRFRCRT